MSIKRTLVSLAVGSIVVGSTHAGVVQLIQTIPLDGARDSCFFPVLNQFFLAVPQRDRQDAEIRVYQPK